MVPIRQTVHKRWLFLPTVVVLLFIPILVRAEVPGPEELFQKILDSYQTVDFIGKFNFTSLAPDQNPAFEAIMIRKAPDKLRIQFVSPPKLSDMGMVTDGKKRWHIPGRGPGRRPMPPRQPSRMLDFLIENAQILLKTHNIEVLAAEAIAERSTYLVVIAPKLPGRPSRKVWVDADMGIILKMESYDSRNRLRWLLAYSEIDFKPQIDEKIFEPRRRIEDGGPRQERGRGELWNYKQGKLNLGKIRKEVKLDVIIPEKPPAGFILQSVQAVRFGKWRNIHLTYVDGLSVISVFQSLSNGGEPRGRRGPRREDRPSMQEDRPPIQDPRVEKIDVNGVEVQVMSRGPMFILRWNQQKIYLTLIGDLEKAEMINIVKAFFSKKQ